MLLALPPLLWYVAIPDPLIPRLIAAQAEKLGVAAEIRGFKKGPLLDFRAKGLVIKNGGAELLSIEGISGRINPLKLPALTLNVLFSGSACRGSVRGEFFFAAGLASGRKKVNAHLEEMRIEDIPPLAQAGVKGVLEGNLLLEGKRGTFIFKIAQMEGFPLDFKSSNGVLELAPEAVVLRSVSLEGDGLYARLKGRIKGGLYELTAELMPQKEIRGLALMRRYEASPGYYVIPLSGSLRGSP